jgi:hypothetical protein
MFVLLVVWRAVEGGLRSSSSIALCAFVAVFAVVNSDHQVVKC